MMVMEVCFRIVNCVMEFQCTDPTSQMLKLKVNTDFVFDLQLRIREPRSTIYNFVAAYNIFVEASRSNGTRSEHPLPYE